MRYNTDIAVLNETKQVDEGQLREEGRGYTFWKGTPAQVRSILSIGFAMKNQLISQPMGINKHIITLCLKFNNNQYTTIISAYVLVHDAGSDIKEQVYSNPDYILPNTRRTRLFSNVRCYLELWYSWEGRSRES